MKICVSGGKGGTGKSAVAAALATLFSQKAQTLVVDADVECPNSHLNLGIERRVEAPILQSIPKWDFDKCIRCGKCAEVCKQNAIAFVKGKNPAFAADLCIGCQACKIACPVGAISESTKEIGEVSRGEGKNIILMSGELKIGQPASGDVVTAVRKHAEDVFEAESIENMVIDAAAGVGCPVIASLVGTDYAIAVTEPTPSALSDLKRMLFLANHFQIPRGIVINKYDLEASFCQQIELFAEENNIPILGYLPYSQDFVHATLKMKPVTLLYPQYTSLFEKILEQIA